MYVSQYITKTNFQGASCSRTVDAKDGVCGGPPVVAVTPAPRTLLDTTVGMLWSFRELLVPAVGSPVVPHLQSQPVPAAAVDRSVVAVVTFQRRFQLHPAEPPPGSVVR